MHIMHDVGQEPIVQDRLLLGVNMAQYLTQSQNDRKRRG